MTDPIRALSEKRVTASIVAIVDPDVTIARALRGRLVREIGRMVKAVALREKLPHLALEVPLMMDASTRELARDHRKRCVNHTWPRPAPAPTLLRCESPPSEAS